MKKIGFIDYYLDEWHANNYPAWIRESSFKEKFGVTFAYAEKDKEGGMTTKEWCNKNKINAVDSIEELIEKSDCIIVLSPDNSERHEDLSKLPLESKKPLYIDKTFAPDLATAKRIFDRAEKHNTPMFSSSALRFAEELTEIKKILIKDKRLNFISIHGGGVFKRYSVHQLEMLVNLMGVGAKKVMQSGTRDAPLLIIDYPDKRRGVINIIPDSSFHVSIQYGDKKGACFDIKSSFFRYFIEAVLKFFVTKETPFDKNQTLEIIALIEAGNDALIRPDTWIALPK